jgi:hypothetical protein
MNKKKFISRIETGGPVEYDFNSDDEGYLYRTDSQIIIHWSVILDFFMPRILILPLILGASFFGFGLKPVNAVSKNELAQISGTIVKEKNFSLKKNRKKEDVILFQKKENEIRKDSPKIILQTQNFERVAQRLTEHLSDHNVSLLKVIGGGLMIGFKPELLAMQEENQTQKTWPDLLKKPAQYVYENKYKIAGIGLTISIIYCTIIQRNYLISISKRVFKLMNELHFCSAEFELLKVRNQTLVNTLQKTFFELERNYFMVHSDIAKIQKLELFMEISRTRLLECQLQLKNAKSLPESTKIYLLQRILNFWSKKA